MTCRSCGGAASCGCTYTGSDSISISGTGSVGDPVIAYTRLHPTNPGLEVVAAQGLRVKTNSAGGLRLGSSGIEADPTQFLPRGTVAYAQTTSVQSGINTTVIDLASLVASWTATSTRRYRISSFVTCLQVGVNGGQQILITNSVNTQVITSVNGTVAGEYTTHQPSVILTGLSDVVTYKLRGYDSAGTMNTGANATQPMWILVEDIGI